MWKITYFKKVRKYPLNIARKLSILETVENMTPNFTLLQKSQKFRISKN